MTLFHRRTAMLVLALEPHEACVCRIQRQGRQNDVSAPLRVPIPASLFRSSPIKAAEQLRAALQEAHIRPDHCVVCLPLSWAFTAEFEFPSLSDTDLQSYIQLEAERRFPLSIDDMMVTVAYRQPGTNGQRALLVGMSKDYLTNLEKALHAVKLTPAHITFGLSSLAEATDKAHALLFHLGNGFADLAVLNHDAIPLFKNLSWQEDTSHPDVHEIIRQLRITLAQLPTDRRSSLSTATVYQDHEWPEDTLSSLSAFFSSQHIALESGKETNPAVLSAIAAHGVTWQPPIEFVTRHKDRFRTLLNQVSAGRTRWILGTVGALLFLLVATFGLQAHTLARLERKWAEASPKINEAKQYQEHIRKYRSWYDESIPSLDISASLFDAFPEESTVWIKSLVIKDQAKVTCSGNASSRKDWMQVLRALGQNKNLEDLQVVQTRGETPFSFTLTFRWKGIDSHGS